MSLTNRPLYNDTSYVRALGDVQKWVYNGMPIVKMTGGTPEVRSVKSLTLMTFNIRHLTNGPMDQRTNGPIDQWTNGLMD